MSGDYHCWNIAGQLLSFLAFLAHDIRSFGYGHPITDLSGGSSLSLFRAEQARDSVKCTNYALAGIPVVCPDSTNKIINLGIICQGSIVFIQTALKMQVILPCKLHILMVSLTEHSLSSRASGRIPP